MIMDAKDIESYLKALQRLYGLLKTDGTGTPIITSYNILDVYACQVLKYLLDAAQEVLKEHAEASPVICATLKRPKDRSVIICHHYHYHHKKKNDEKSSLSRAEVEKYGEKVVEAKLKSAIHGKKHENQFQGLKETVLSHVRRSKISKSDRKSVPLTKGYQRGQKGVKKSQWAN